MNNDFELSKESNPGKRSEIAKSKSSKWLVGACCESPNQ